MKDTKPGIAVWSSPCKCSVDSDLLHCRARAHAEGELWRHDEFEKRRKRILEICFETPQISSRRHLVNFANVVAMDYRATEGF